MSKHKVDINFILKLYTNGVDNSPKDIISLKKEIRFKIPNSHKKNTFTVDLTSLNYYNNSRKIFVGFETLNSVDECFFGFDLLYSKKVKCIFLKKNYNEVKWGVISNNILKIKLGILET